MSRSGTVQDALRFVDEFQRATVPSSHRVKESAAAVARGDAEDVVRQDRGTGRRERREKSEKDDAQREGRRDKDRRHSSRRRRKNALVKARDSESDDDDDDEDTDEGEDDERTERRAERKKKKDKREHRKKKERKSSSRRSERENEKERARKREKRKQQRRQQRSRRLRSPEDDSSQSEDKDSDSGSESSESQGRDSALRAEQVADGILQEFPEVENDLQQLLQTVDSGQAVDISGLPNRRLVVLLQDLFQSLNLKKSTAGVYLLPSGAQPILERLSWSSVSRSQPKGGTSGELREHGSEFPRPMSIERDDPAANPTSHSKMEATSGPLPRPNENLDAPKRRVIGPAMPSAEMLEAAAKLTEAEEALRDAEAALDNDPLIGPPPPAAVAEAASANDAERFEEVTRITASDVGDAYDILGLKQGVSPGDLKKRYWKLSLLVHPDKCQHPLAHQAFMALNKAFKDLQDPLKRSEIDRKADEKQAKEDYEEEMRLQLQAAQWRRLRGEEALPGDAELLRGDVKDPGRDEWMTKLPPERQAGGPPSQQNTFFSRTEKRGRGDTSAWTDTPLEKAERAKMQYLEAYKQAALTGPENTESLFEKEKTAKTASFLDEYNQKKRSLSLLEEHQQKSKTGLKKAKKERSQPQEEKKKEWAEAHPWKPWDREKDLTAGRQTMKWDDKKSVGDSLGSRFGSSGGQRTFL